MEIQRVRRDEHMLSQAYAHVMRNLPETPSRS